MFVDIESDTASTDGGLIEQAIAPRTKAILTADACSQPDWM